MDRGDIKDLISSKVHLKTSVIGVTLSFIAWKHQLEFKSSNLKIEEVVYVTSKEFIDIFTFVKNIHKHFLCVLKMNF